MFQPSEEVFWKCSSRSQKCSTLSPSFHHLFTIFSPPFHFSQICQLFTNLPNFRQFTIFSPSFHQLAEFSPTFQNYNILGSSPSCGHLFTNFLQTCKVFENVLTFFQLAKFPAGHHLLTIFAPSFHHLAKFSLVRKLFTNLPHFRQFTIVSQSFHQLAGFSHFPNLPNFRHFTIFSPSFHQITMFAPSCRSFTHAPTFHQLAIFVCSSPSFHNLFTNLPNCCKIDTTCQLFGSSPSFHHLSPTHNHLFTNLPNLRSFTQFHCFRQLMPTFHQLTIFSPSFNQLAIFWRFTIFSTCSQSFHNFWPTCTKFSTGHHILTMFSQTCNLFLRQCVKRGLRRKCWGRV